MDDAFPNLEDISDEQTLERLESLFESASGFPGLDSPNFAPTTTTAAGVSNTSAFDVSNDNSAAGNLLGGGGGGGGVESQDIFGSNSLFPKPPAPSPSQPPPAVFTSSSVVVSSVPSSLFQTQPSTIMSAPASVRSLILPSSAPQTLVYAKPSLQSAAPAAAAGSPLTTPTSFILNSQPTMLQQQPQQMLQIQLPPGTTRTLTTDASKLLKQQPQLLPKPQQTKTNQLPVVVSSSPLILNPSTGVLQTSTVQPGQTSAPLLINNLGQVVGSAAQATNPILIQQPNGNPLIVLRPQAPSILPIAAQQATTATPQILLQQPTTANVINAQPQVKIITPQGRMQMQQIQTSTGPKLIAVPVGQTILQQPQATPQFMTMSPSPSSAAPVPLLQSPVSSKPPTVIPSPDATGKKKKGKKKSKKESGVDLGELMKDVGLDLDGFEDSSAAPQAPTAMPTVIPAAATPLATAATVTSSQLVAQIQQPMTVQPSVAGGQLQLIQGPDGQFVLQSATAPPPQPTIITQQTAEPTIVLPTTPIPSMSPTKGNTPRSRPNNDPNRVPLYEDDRLPFGWHRKVSQRKSGASAGRYEVFIIGPTGKRFRSRNELKTFFEKTGEKTLDPEDFDFTPFGNGRTGEGSSSSSLNPGTPKLTVSSTRTISSTTPVQIAQRITPAAAVSMPTSIQSMTSSPVILAQHNVSPPKPAINLLQSIQQPLPPSTLEKQIAPAPSVVPAFSSQESREAADADAQLSQLIETMQKDPQSLAIESEKMADFLKSLSNETEKQQQPQLQLQQPQPQLQLQQPQPQPSQLPLAPMDIPAVAIGAGPSTTASSISPKTAPELTSGTTGFQASFLNSIAPNRMEDEASSLTPVPTSVATGAASSISPALSTASSSSGLLSPGGSVLPTVSMGGGAASQMRQLQNLPPNTRLVKGPNGQFTLQKIQAIELSPTMQQTLKGIQSRVNEIESKTFKSRQDEAELAQLQTKQQHILASGKPVAGPPTQTSLSTATQVVNSIQPRPSLVSNVPTVTTQAVPSAPKPTGSGGGLLSNIPALTDQQRKIVHVFKQKMASLPPDQQAKFIAQNRAALIKQLNFQPTQLQQLKNSNPLFQQQQQQPQQGPSMQQPATMQPKPVLPGLGPPQQPQQPQQQQQQQIQVQQQPLQVVVDHNNQQGNVLKRPASTALPELAAPILKHKKVAWVESQIKKDQNEAVAPNYRTPFRSKEDACKRLLRYHVFGEMDPTPKEMREAEDGFETKASGLLDKYNTMLNKYHYLLVQESIRLSASSEEVMLARMWDTDERQALAKEKEEFKARQQEPVVTVPEAPTQPMTQINPGNQMPQLDEAVSEQTESSMHVDEASDAGPPDLSQQPSSSSEQVFQQPAPGGFDPSQQQENSEKFLGLKFSRSTSGNWQAGNKRKQMQAAAAAAGMPKVGEEDEESDDDDDFGLKDISAQAVGSILEEDDLDLSHFTGEQADDQDAALGHFAEEDANDNDSLHNAINSILDLPQDERMETPDLNNIAGLLDSMEGDMGGAGEQDAATEAAVNSILG